MRAPYLTFKERELIEKYSKEGKSGGEIARLLNRGRTTINREIRLNGYEDYTAKKAQERHETVKKEGKERVSQKLKGTHTPHTYTTMRKNRQRIDELEMQIDILCETIKELKDDKKVYNVSGKDKDRRA